MLVEDYTPHRLGAVRTSLQHFLQHRTSCDIGLIVFGGNAIPYSIASGDSCYATSKLQSIGPNLVRNGTAIGDAIWLALHSLDSTQASKKLVIIGDGDNTAGYLSPIKASELAKKYNLVIYTIGVGTKELASFGKDDFGNPIMVDNTFSDIDFKKIATITGGAYFWAKDASAVASILADIFK